MRRLAVLLLLLAILCSQADAQNWSGGGGSGGGGSVPGWVPNTLPGTNGQIFYNNAGTFAATSTLTSGAINWAGNIATTGTIQGATVTSTGALSGTTISGTSITATGTVSGATVSSTGNLTAAGQLQISGAGANYITGGNTTIGAASPLLGTLNVHTGTNQNFLVRGPVDIATGTSLFAVNDANSATVPLELGPSLLDINAPTGIENNNPGFLLTVGNGTQGSVIFSLNGASGVCNHTPGSASETVACTSDMRLKRAIEPTQYDALADLGSMPIVDFRVRRTGELVKYGTVAQQMLGQHGSMVHTDRDGFYQVDEVSSWELVRAIQQLEKRVKTLEARR
jgi:hypothetical protein